MIYSLVELVYLEREPLGTLASLGRTQVELLACFTESVLDVLDLVFHLVKLEPVTRVLLAVLRKHFHLVQQVLRLLVELDVVLLDLLVLIVIRNLLIEKGLVFISLGFSVNVVNLVQDL